MYCGPLLHAGGEETHESILVCESEVVFSSEDIVDENACLATIKKNERFTRRYATILATYYPSPLINFRFVSFEGLRHMHESPSFIAFRSSSLKFDL